MPPVGKEAGALMRKLVAVLAGEVDENKREYRKEREAAEPDV